MKDRKPENRQKKQKKKQSKHPHALLAVPAQLVAHRSVLTSSVSKKPSKETPGLVYNTVKVAVNTQKSKGLL